MDQADAALARAKETAERRLARLETLARVGRLVSSSLDLDAVLREIAQAAASLMDVVLVGVWVADEATRTLEIGAFSDDALDAGYPARRAPFGQGIHGWVAERRRPLRVADLAADERVLAREWVRAHGLTSALAVPILDGAALLGVLAMNRRTAFDLEPEDEELLDAFVAQAAAAIRNARLFRESEARQARLATLVEVAQRLTRGLELPQVLDAIVAAAAQVFDGEAGIRLVQGQELVRVAATPEAREAMVRERLRLGESLSGRVAVTGEACVVPETAADPRLVPEHRASQSPRIGALLCVPVRAGARVLGTLSVYRERGYRFDVDALALATSLADQAGIAIQNASLYAEATRRRREAEALARVAGTLTESLDVATVGRRIVESVVPLFGARSAGLRLLRPDGSLVAVASTDPSGPHAAPGHVFQAGTGVSGRIVAEGRPFASEDTLADPRVVLDAAIRERVVRAGFSAVLGVPLRVEGRVVGTLSVADRTGRRFTGEEAALLQAFADQAALALENARLYEEAERGRRAAEVVAELAREVNAALDPERILQRVVEAARELCRADLAHIALRDPEAERVTVEFRYWAGDRRSTVQRFPVEPGKGIGGQTLLTGRPFRTDDCARDPRITKDYLPVIQAEGVRASMAAPIRVGGALEGLLFTDSRSRAFTAEDEALLVQLADHAAVAVRNARLLAGEQAARAAAEASEERFRGLVESLDAIVWEGDAETQRFTFVSRRAEAILGYPVARWLEEPGFWARLIHADDQPRVVAHFRECVEAGRVAEFEYRALAADGRVVWLRDSVNAVPGPDGRPRYLRGLMVDVTARRRAEEALRASEARKAAVLESALDAVVTMDVEGRVVEFNPAAERIFGYPRAAVLGRDVGELLLPPGRRARHRVGLARLRATGENPLVGSRREMTAMRRDGTEFPIEVAVTRVPSEGLALYTAFVRDLSEREAAEAERARLEAQLRQAQKMEAVGRLAGGVAHDFNNLLAVILGHSELLQAALGDEDPLREHAEEIRHASDRAAGLTRQLLAFSRRQLLKPEVVDLNALATGLAAMLRRLIGEDVELVTQLQPGLGAAQADPGQVEQVVMNLAVNARDAMPGGGRLTLETADVDLDEAFVREHAGAAPGPHVMLAVGDTGGGMSAEVRAHLFEPFFTTKGPGKGTGLGLSTVYGIVKQHRGCVTVESEPGRGSVFRVFLPRLGDRPAPAGRTAAPAPAPRGSETILLVEDEPAVRDLVRRVLTQHGYAVLVARDGAEALELVRARGPEPLHLLVTDVVMPHVNGRELAERLAPLRPETRVLYVSGYTDDALAPHGVVEPGTRLLQKPFSPDALLALVREILDS